MAGKRRHERTEVSCVIKYLVFGFNVLFWIFGGLICGAGVWAMTEKDMIGNIGKLTKISVDPALIFMILGAWIFVVGFLGCVGALRENMCLLFLYSGAIGIIFLAQVVFAVLAFVYKDWMKDQIEQELKDIIVNYRDDPDLQNLIDWVQEEWLHCCGVKDYKDWDTNIYFNCTSPSREACGVPFSCCKRLENQIIDNRQCGYDSRDVSKVPNPDNYIYTNGCLTEGISWLNKNLVPVAAVVVAIALIQVLSICLASSLRTDIRTQLKLQKVASHSRKSYMHDARTNRTSHPETQYRPHNAHRPPRYTFESDA